MTITEFLLARIAEDEAVAREIQREDWSYDVAANREVWVDADRVSVGVGRVLAECEAKRRIVAEHQIETSADDPVCRHIAQVPCPTLRALAAIYADHPDYDEAWRRGDGA